MANTLTNLIPPLYEALDVVSRELVGLIPAVTTDSGVERAAVGQTVYSPVAPAATMTDITPGVTPINDGDQTIGSIPIVITKAKRSPIRWNGEDTRGVNSGIGRNRIQVQQIAQSLRVLTNAIEADLAALQSTFSRATGTAGTTPFASTLTDPAQARKILADNGAPMSDLQMVINTTSGAAMRTLTQLTKANEAGTDETLRRGTLLELDGFQIRESAQILTPAVGTSSNTGTTNTAGYALGATVITLAAAGTGTILAGDIVTFTGDTNKYVVASGIASLAAGGTITLAAPGLQKALPASAVTVSVVAQSARNMFFGRHALILAQRLPARPPEGDLADDVATIQDPISGLVFEIAHYPQYRQSQFEVACVWGVANVKPEHTGLLLG